MLSLRIIGRELKNRHTKKGLPQGAGIYMNTTKKLLCIILFFLLNYLINHNGLTFISISNQIISGQ